MSAAIDLLWEQARERLFITREQFEQGLQGWHIDPVENERGTIAAVFVSRGPVFHFAKFDKALRCTKAHLRKYPGELIQRHGYAFTTTPKDDTRQIAFNKRIGFFVVGEDEHDYHMRIEKLRHTI